MLIDDGSEILRCKKCGREYPSVMLEEKQELSNQFYMRARNQMEQFGEEISDDGT